MDVELQTLLTTSAFLMRRLPHESRYQPLSYSSEETEKSRLFDCPLDSDDEKEETHDDVLNTVRQHSTSLLHLV